jgi:hypothetical protein
MNQSSSTAFSPPAERMRRYRQRRRSGLRCLTIQLRETEIDMLVCRAVLEPEMPNNRNAIIIARTPSQLEVDTLAQYDRSSNSADNC